MKKLSLSILLVMALIAMMFAGCASDDTSEDSSATTGGTESSTTTETEATTEETTDSTSESSDEVVEIRVAWWGSETRHANTLAAIEVFEEQNPNIKVVPEYQGWDGYKDKLIAQVLAGNAPDVYSNIGEWYSELLEGEALMDITDQVDVSGHNPKYVEACSVDGVMYGVNLSVNGKTIVMNKTLFEELGVELLEEPYTWDDLAAKSVEIYEASGGTVYGIPDFSLTADGMGFPMFVDYAVAELGAGDDVPFDNDSYNLTQDQVAAYYQWYADLRDVNGVAPADVSTMNDFSANSLLLQRSVAMECNFAGTFGRFQDQMEDELVMIPMPSGDNGETADSARPGIILSIYDKIEDSKKEAALKFLDFMTNSADAALALKTCRGVLPTEVQRAALNDTEGALTDTDKKVNAVVDTIMARDLMPFYAGPSGNSELSTLFVEYGQEIAFGYSTVDEAAAKFMEQVGKLAE